MLSTIMHDDFVWTAITGALSGKRRKSNTNFINMNCTMCVSRGETPDTRQRCGIKNSHEGTGVYCFNCGFRARFVLGNLLSKDMKEFLLSLGIPSRDVQFINHKAAQYRRMIANSPEAMAIVPAIHKPTFKEMALPAGARTFAQCLEDGVTETDFIEVAAYLFDRGDVIANAMEYYWTPSTDEALNRRVIVPFRWQGKIVGWTGRLIDEATAKCPKYWSQVPSHYIFNSEAIDSDRKFIIVSEGPFDGIATDGVATLGAKLSDEQAFWLNSTDKKKIVVADRDKSGQRQIDMALKYGWMVSFPRLKEGHGFQNWWDPEIKDPAEASKHYGKLYTIRSIVESATENKIEINIKRKLLF
jgi:hypothetical protein